MKEYPLVSKWFQNLSKRPEFVGSVWKASDDSGYACYNKFILRNRKTTPLADISSRSQKTTPQFSPLESGRSAKVAKSGGSVPSSSKKGQKEARKSPASPTSVSALSFIHY